MLNDLAESNLTNVEVRNWVENDEDLLPLEEADGDEPEVSEHEGSELDNQNKTVKNAEAAKSFNLCLKWAEENDIPLSDILVLQRLKEMAFMNNQRCVKQTKITNYFRN